MKVDLFDYELPQEAIAQQPAARGTSRMLICNRKKPEPQDGLFADFPGLLYPGDLLIMNNTRVIPARLFGILDTGGHVELLLIRELSQGIWQTLCRPSRKLKIGRIIRFMDNMSCKVTQTGEEGLRVVQFDGDVNRLMDNHGHMPLPPYIHRQDLPEDQDWYQTIYAREKGSIAAPTAGLHFTDQTLQHLAERDVETAFVTLHVSIGTFKPVTAGDTDDHVMDREYYSISPETASKINRAIREGRRIIAVGTTTVRTLESAFLEGKRLIRPGTGSTNLFITPGFSFNVTGALLTNFHLPRSTLIMLVSAFSDTRSTLYWYRFALDKQYRFYSYGDCMFIT